MHIHIALRHFDNGGNDIGNVKAVFGDGSIIGGWHRCTTTVGTEIFLKRNFDWAVSTSNTNGSICFLIISTNQKSIRCKSKFQLRTAVRRKIFNQMTGKNGFCVIAEGDKNDCFLKFAMHLINVVCLLEIKRKVR